VTPTIGRIVHYTLSSADAEAIGQRRFTDIADSAGNQAAEGDVYPAMIVRTCPPGAAVNLQVLLDGNDSYWATSRTEGEGPGFWSWPPRV